MKETSKKGEQFYRQWEKQREKKWYYVFIHVSIYWGLSVAIFTYLWSAHFEIENRSILKLLSSLAVFMIAGLWVGLSQFKRIDSIYLGLNDEAEIRKGIQTIESGENWNYENLIISKTTYKTLNIQNQLIWFEDKDLTSEKIGECFNLILVDYQRLKKNIDFECFVTDRKVRVQIMDNSEKEILLMEKLI